jgi:two-component system chemotaxis response regulator CheY
MLSTAGVRIMTKDINVLIVDDAEYVRTMTIAMLHNIGIHTITEAADGATALDIIRKKEIDIVLLDVVMENMTGLDVLKEVRGDKAISMMKIILVTGAADVNVIRAARQASMRADAVIVKPFSVATLKEKITSVLKSPAPPPVRP